MLGSKIVIVVRCGNRDNVVCYGKIEIVVHCGKGDSDVV